MEKEISAFSFKFLFIWRSSTQTDIGRRLKVTAYDGACFRGAKSTVRRVASRRVRITLLRCCVGIVDLLEASCTKFANTGIDYHTLFNRIIFKQFAS